MEKKKIMRENRVIALYLNPCEQMLYDGIVIQL